MKRSFLIPLMSLATLAHGQDVEVPHEFQPGTPARAEEVNENFSVIAAAANANAASIGELLSAGAIDEIGTLSITAPPYSDQQIPVVSIQWSGGVEGVGGGGAAVASFGGITVAKPFDLFSPQLLTDYAALRSMPAVRIDLSAANTVLATFTLESAYISSLGASPHPGGTPLETVQFTFERITLSATDPATNTTTMACFDIVTNAAC